MTTYPNPFRINLDTLRRADQELTIGQEALLVANMWYLFHDADDTGVADVGNTAAIPWDEAGAYLGDLDLNNALEVLYLYGENIADTIAVFECLAPQFDALSDDDDRFLCLREIDADTRHLHMSR